MKTSSSLRKAMQERVIIADGAMGTMKSLMFQSQNW
jgi:methionine synthase I (cobalamin-dependent)